MIKSLGSRKLHAALFGLLAIALLGFFFRGADFGAIAESLVGADWKLVATAVGVTMVTYVVRALRWRVLLTPVGRPRFVPCFVTTVIGFMVNFMAPTGRLGELARPYLLAKREGFSASSAFATVFLERFLDLATVVFLVGAWLLLGTPPPGAKSAAAVDGLKLGGVTASLGAGLGLVVMFVFARHRDRAMARAAALAERLPRRLGRAGFRFLSAFGEGLGVLVDPRNLARAAVLSLLLWLNISFAFWLSARAFGIVIPFGATFLVIGFLTVGVALPTPGAVGGYHVMCSLALTLLFGVDEPTAKATALASHAIAFVPVSLLGMVLFVREGLSFQQIKTIETSG